MTEPNRFDVPLPGLHIGHPVDDVATPALLIDLDRFEHNLALAASLTTPHGVSLRPHAKAHKCATIARRQIAAGAVGVCCQKLSEAFALAGAGVSDIHLSNELADARKATLAAQLAAQVKLSVCVDHPESVRQLGVAAADAGSRIELLVEVDIGQNRCGVSTVEAMLALVDEIATHPSLSFRGLQAYHGGVQHVHGWQQRRESAQQSAARAAQFVAALEQRGLRGLTVTGGGTGSIEFDVASGVFTEIQAGSYALMDRQYGELEWRDSFRPAHALHLGATIMSTPAADRVICDVGLKSLTVDAGLPSLARDHNAPALTGWDYALANDEHGILRRAPHHSSHEAPAWGSRLRLIPGHVDPTVNLHDAYVCHRGGRVEAVWPIEARGMAW
jgi:D-serine deaminase-like pyridoxal phosphate-dependent protein